MVGEDAAFARQRPHRVKERLESRRALAVGRVVADAAARLRVDRAAEAVLAAAEVDQQQAAVALPQQRRQRRRGIAHRRKRRHDQRQRRRHHVFGTLGGGIGAPAGGHRQ